MPTITRSQVVYAEDVVAAEYGRLGFWRRLVLRWVSRDLHDAARHLSRSPRGYVNVPVMAQPPKPQKDRGYDHLVSDLMGVSRDR